MKYEIDTEELKKAINVISKDVGESWGGAFSCNSGSCFVGKLPNGILLRIEAMTEGYAEEEHDFDGSMPFDVLHEK